MSADDEREVIGALMREVDRPAMGEAIRAAVAWQETWVRTELARAAFAALLDEAIAFRASLQVLVDHRQRHHCRETPARRHLHEQYRRRQLARRNRNRRSSR